MTPIMSLEKIACYGPFVFELCFIKVCPEAHCLNFTYSVKSEKRNQIKTQAVPPYSIMSDPESEKAASGGTSSDFYDSDSEEHYESEDETEFVLNMRDKMHFPTFESLPEDDDLDLRYYSDPGRGVSGPIKHWCLLVEIIEQIPYLRPMFTVKDKAGKRFLVAFYLDNDVVQPKIWEKHCKAGGVIAIMYATRRTFMDGQRGVRVEEVKNITFLPCSLSALLDIGDDLGKEVSNVCGSCGEAATQHCSRCSVVKYCGKDCQTRDWKARHKHNCAAIHQVLELKKRDWRDFDEYWME